MQNLLVGTKTKQIKLTTNSLEANLPISRVPVLPFSSLLLSSHTQAPAGTLSLHPSSSAQVNKSSEG